MEMFLNMCHSSKSLIRLLPTVTLYRHCSTSTLKLLNDNNNEQDIQTYFPRENSALDIYSDDLSDLAPHFPRTFNVAAYVNKSDTLKKLLSLNVNLSKIEKKKPHIVERFLRLDFEKDMKNHILFLTDYVQDEYLADFLTKNPMIFYEDIEDLKVRINYLYSKKFKDHEIQSIISRNPFWLMFSTTRIDSRLGFFQNNFNLTGEEVRFLVGRDPKIITYNMHSIQTNNFSIKLEMGFKKEEVKCLLLKTPNIWKMNHMSLLRRFNYIHNVMKISHETICQFPRIFYCREFRVKQRHMFLEKLGRAQFDPKKENYVPIMGLVEGTDLDFCKNYAKCTVDDFNLYLKTL